MVHASKLMPPGHNYVSSRVFYLVGILNMIVRSSPPKVVKAVVIAVVEGWDGSMCLETISLGLHFSEIPDFTGKEFIHITKKMHQLYHHELW